MTKKQRITLMSLFGLALFLGCGLLLLTHQKPKNQEKKNEKADITVEIMVMIPTESLKGRISSPTEPTSVVTEQMITATPSATCSAESLPNNTSLKATKKPSDNNEKSASPKTAFMITILGKEIPVAYGVDEATLDQSPGWLTSSVKPGESGTCIVYGHRNRNHLQVLKNIAVGDQILITLSNESALKYIVRSIKILPTEKVLHFPITEDKQLLITTCYPFHYNGHAPQKMIVTAFLYE